MNVKNEFIYSLNQKYAHLQFDKRQFLVKKMVADFADFFSITLNPNDDEEEFPLDLMFETEVDGEYVEGDLGKIDPEREKRIRALEEWAKSEGLQEKEEITPFKAEIKRFGRSALHEAILNEDIDGIKQLIKDGANLFAKDNNGNSPLNLAQMEEKTEIVKILSETMKGKIK